MNSFKNIIPFPKRQKKSDMQNHVSERCCRHTKVLRKQRADELGNKTKLFIILLNRHRSLKTHSLVYTTHLGRMKAKRKRRSLSLSRGNPFLFSSGWLSKPFDLTLHSFQVTRHPNIKDYNTESCKCATRMLGMLCNHPLRIDREFAMHAGVSCRASAQWRFLGHRPLATDGYQGPVSRKSRELFGPEKLVVKLQSPCFEKLIFLHVFNRRKIKRIAKFEGLEPRRCEDIKGIVAPERDPKSFGTFGKQAPELNISYARAEVSPRFSK